MLQIMIAAAALAGAALAPPAHGALLAIPLGGTPVADTINIALARGARIVGAGPFAGSIVLDGDLDRLAGPLRARGVILLAGSSALCR